jgi:hypothetical protein
VRTRRLKLNEFVRHELVKGEIDITEGLFLNPFEDEVNKETTSESES